MAAELPRPGVEVIQEFRTVSPSVVTPTLVPCVVGACRQIVEVLNGSALNEDARVALAPFFTSSNAALVGSRYIYTGLDGKVLQLSVNNSPMVTVTFSGTALTPAAVVTAINSAMNADGVFGALAEVKSETLSGALVERTWTLRTIAEGSLQRIEIGAATEPEVWAAFGLKPGWLFAGEDWYTGSLFSVPATCMPDPRNNLSELEIDADSIRVFFATTSANVRELHRRRGFCRRGSTVHLYDDGNGDALTPYVDMVGQNFTAAATGSYVSGNSTLTSIVASLPGLTLELQGEATAQTYTFVDNLAYPLTSTNELLVQLNAFFTEFTFTAPGDILRITSKTLGQDSRVLVLGGSAVEELGLTAVRVGSVDTTAIVYGGGGALENKSVKIDGVTYTFAAGQPTNGADLVSELAAAFPGLDFSIQAATNFLVIRKIGTGSFEIQTVASDAYTALGIAVGVYTQPATTAGAAFPVQAGDELFVNGRSYGTISSVAPNGVVYRLRMSAQVAMTTPATVTGTVAMSAITFPGGFHAADKALTIGATTYTFTNALAPTDAADLLAILAAAFTGYRFELVTVSGQDYLRITRIGSGPLVISGTACAVLGFTPGTYQQVLGDNFYIVANNLTGAATRPQPELLVSGGVPTISPNVLRDTAGVPFSFAHSYAYLAYKALRKDVSPAAARPGLLRFDSIDELTTTLGPISSDNPLALGLYFALLAAPGAQVSGMGIDEVTADAPEGTVEAFARAAEFLEGVEVYSLAPLTHDRTVGEVYATHVATMSSPENKGERIVLFSTNTPTHELDVLVASGTTGNSTGPQAFDTGIANLSSLLLAAGVPNPVGTIDASYGVFLDLASDSKHYNVESILGGVITLRQSFSGGGNDDGFFAETSFPPSGTPLIDETFAIKIRGQRLLLPTGKPDKAKIALTVQEYARTMGNRRYWHVVPDGCAATVGGIEQVLPSYYVCAGYAGLIAGQPPQQSFTNFPLPGFTRIIGSNDTFTEKQLNVIAAGGNWIVVQDTPQSALISRHALTTDITSVETRTDSITKVVDFTAKIMRRGYRNFIGRFNITQGYLDSLGSVGQGILTFLTESGVLIGGSINNIVQDERQPDKVLVDCVLDPPYPSNYLRLTLVI